MSLTIVDMTGDRYWPDVAAEIRTNLIDPFFDVDWKIHDISIYARDKTNDGALQDAIADLKEHKAAVKGPTVTPTVKQTEDYGLSQQLGSPNGIIRSAIQGAVIMRSPIEANNLPQFSEKIHNVTTARQAVGGRYGAPNFDIPEGGKLRITLETEDGNVELMAEKTVEPGVAMMLTESNDAIRDFVHETLEQGLLLDKSVVFASKNTINPVYDGRFIETFNDVFEQEYADRYAEQGLNVKFDELIDAAVSKIPQGKMNDWIVAFKNYDGDVGSDQLAGETLSLGMMDSTLTSADGTLLADPPHGTADDLEAKWVEEGIMLANPTAYIYAYAEAIRHKADLEGIDNVVDMAIALKASVVETIESGKMTGDISRGANVTAISGQEFIAEVAKTFETKLNANMKFGQNGELGHGGQEASL